jgi:RNA polymerase sigma factor (sigma-70 family)
MAPSQREGMSRSEFEHRMALAYPAVYERVARRFKDRQLAEEVSQDALTVAFEVWGDDPDYFNRHDLAAWSGQRAAWRALDRLRQRNRLRPLPDERTPAGEPAAIVWPRPPADAETRRRHEVTWACLQQLPEEDRRILEGRFYDGRTDQEIGDELYGPCGDSQANNLRVWRRRQKAYDRLRELLRAHGVEGPAGWAGQAV